MELIEITFSASTGSNRGYWPFHFAKIGRWWDGKNEIDIAAIDPEGNNIILGDFKYWKQPVGITWPHKEKIYFSLTKKGMRILI